MPPRARRLTASDLVRVLERAGWVRADQRGSHLHLQRPDGTLPITVPMHAGRILKLGTQRAILARAGLTDADVDRLL